MRFSGRGLSIPLPRRAMAYPHGCVTVNALMRDRRPFRGVLSPFQLPRSSCWAHATWAMTCGVPLFFSAFVMTTNLSFGTIFSSQ
jgi:hypothetical protein